MEIVIKIPNRYYEMLKDFNFEIIDGRCNYKTIQIQVVNAIKNGTPLDSIIADIEAARDKDKLCEYPYNRCINIIKKAVGDES